MSASDLPPDVVDVLPIAVILALTVPLGWWVARAGSPGRSRRFHGLLVAGASVVGAVALALFVALLADLATGGEQTSPFWGKTTPGFRFVLGLVLLVMAATAAAGALGTIAVLVWGWSAAWAPPGVDRHRSRTVRSMLWVLGGLSFVLWSLALG